MAKILVQPVGEKRRQEQLTETDHIGAGVGRLPDQSAGINHAVVSDAKADVAIGTFPICVEVNTTAAPVRS